MLLNCLKLQERELVLQSLVTFLSLHIAKHHLCFLHLLLVRKKYKKNMLSAHHKKRKITM